MRILIAIALLVLTVVLWEGHRELALDHKLSKVATKVAGRPVSVDCPGFLRSLLDISANGGSVRFDANGKPSSTTHLQTDVCGYLAAYSHTRKSSDFACVYSSVRCSEKVEHAVYAALVLSHEVQHLRGVSVESDAQCFGIQMLPQVAELLGSPPTEAQAVAKHYLAVQQPWMDQDYALSANCVDGGSLDLHPESSNWPGG